MNTPKFAALVSKYGIYRVFFSAQMEALRYEKCWKMNESCGMNWINWKGISPSIQLYGEKEWEVLVSKGDSHHLLFFPSRSISLSLSPPLSWTVGHEI